MNIAKEMKEIVAVIKQEQEALKNEQSEYKLFLESKTKIIIKILKNDIMIRSS